MSIIFRCSLPMPLTQAINYRRVLYARICSAEEKLNIVSVRGAEPLIFVSPHPSRAKRGEGRIPFKLFQEYTASRKMFWLARSLRRIASRF